MSRNKLAVRIKEPTTYDIQEAAILTQLTWLKSMRYWRDHNVNAFLEVIPADDVKDAPSSAYSWFKGLKERERRAAEQTKR